jgi:hypothetical protein
MPSLPRGHKHPDELRERAVRMELGHAHEPVALDGDLLNPELKRAPATGRRVEAHQQRPSTDSTRTSAMKPPST